MRTISKLMSTAIPVFFCILGFSSCKKEDEIKIDSPAEETEYLSSVYESYNGNDYLNFKFTYNDSKVDTYTTEWDELMISSPVGNSSMLFTVKENGYNYTYSYEDIKYDYNGYITSFACTCTDDDIEKKYNYTFSYNGDKLISIKCISAYYCYTTTLNWENDNLVSLSRVNSDEDGDVDNMDYILTYGSLSNPNHQMSYEVADQIFDASDDNLEMICGLSLVGKFGKGSKSLPTNFTRRYYHSSNTQVDTGTFAYLLDGKNYIIKETVGQDAKYSSNTSYDTYIYNYN